jgi:hypothetical protein
MEQFVFLIPRQHWRFPGGATDNQTIGAILRQVGCQLFGNAIVYPAFWAKGSNHCRYDSSEIYHTLLLKLGKLGMVRLPGYK